VKKPKTLTQALRRLETKRCERRHTERQGRAARRRAALNGTGGTRHSNAHRRQRANEEAWDDVDVPRVLDLISARDASCAFFERVHARAKKGNRVRLVFQDTERISSESLIYLLAQMHKVRLQHGINAITGTYPHLPNVERLLKDSGFLQILGVKQRPLTGRPTTTRYVKCKSETMTRGQSIPELRDELLGTDMLMSKPIGKMVFRALSEAMANVAHHANQEKHLNREALEGRWWLGGQVSRKRNFFELTFYDAGVGIPKTLHRKHTQEKIRAVLSMVPGISPDDGQMIKAAVELGRSRTESSHRGKGMMDIHRLINGVNAGALTIFSRSGEYRYTPTGEQIRNDKNFIEGTLIKWELPLDKVVAFVGDEGMNDDDV
jgi:anti-anti-sigma regulatory factor